MSANCVAAPNLSRPNVDKIPLLSVNVASIAATRVKGAGFASVPSGPAGSITPTTRLRHATIAVTLDLYSHVMPGMQEDAAARVDKSLRTALGRRAKHET